MRCTDVDGDGVVGEVVVDDAASVVGCAYIGCAGVGDGVSCVVVGGDVGVGCAVCVIGEVRGIAPVWVYRDGGAYGYVGDVVATMVVVVYCARDGVAVMCM